MLSTGETRGACAPRKVHMESGAQQRQPNVATMEDFLRETLEETEALLENLDDAVERVRNEFRGRREHLRARLYALRLADEETFDKGLRELASDLSVGGLPQVFSLDAKLGHQG